ncbi:MAG: 5'-nucleotidase C-terminal domain-containing protein [Dysgonamonadaceae bacterium]|jgi:2',3'-cyclic-nucleotide 2'-phosphodiesterase (5'-nucleotidase family)|nr:5'-nucleotidase C-terminal domain-containing protein [Dysgonamonadaceae bacterium]
MKKTNLKTAGILLFIAATTTTAGTKQYTVKSIEVTRVEMDVAWEPVENTEMRTLVDSLRTKMFAGTQTVIGTAEQILTKGKPQSLLGNFTADVIFDYATGLWGHVDFAVTNMGGIRSSLNQGAITIGNMYEIFPFNNRIVLLELQGQTVNEFFNSIAQREGEVLSKNIEAVIKDKSLLSLKIGGEAIDENKIYLVATVDYRAEGHAGVGVLTKAVKVTDSNMLIRDVLTEYIKRQTAENKTIDAHLDNRITILQ